MAKKSYIGVGGKARQIKKWYVGVGGKARKVKKGYIGIGGVARPFMSGGKLAYYGAITELLHARDSLAGASVGNYALFAGGSNRSGILSAVDAYSSSLVKGTSIAFLSEARVGLAGASVGDYALFAGGASSNDPVNSSVTTVDAYDSSLVRSTPTGLSQARTGLAGATVGNYALFAGGFSSGGYSITVDAYVVK